MSIQAVAAPGALTSAGHDPADRRRRRRVQPHQVEERRRCRGDHDRRPAPTPHHDPDAAASADDGELILAGADGDRPEVGTIDGQAVRGPVGTQPMDRAGGVDEQQRPVGRRSGDALRRPFQRRPDHHRDQPGTPRSTRPSSPTLHQDLAMNRTRRTLPSCRSGSRRTTAVSRSNSWTSPSSAPHTWVLVAVAATAANTIVPSARTTRSLTDTR